MIPVWYLPVVATLVALATWMIARRRVLDESHHRRLAEWRAAAAEDRARYHQQRADAFFRALTTSVVAGSDLPPRGEGLPELAPTVVSDTQVEEQNDDKDLSSGGGAPSGGATTEVGRHRRPAYRYRWPVDVAAPTWHRGVWARIRTRLRRLRRTRVRITRVPERDRSPWHGVWSQLLPDERRRQAAAEAHRLFAEVTGRRGHWTPGILRWMRHSLPRPAGHSLPRPAGRHREAA